MAKTLELVTCHWASLWVNHIQLQQALVSHTTGVELLAHMLQLCKSPGFVRTRCCKIIGPFRKQASACSTFLLFDLGCDLLRTVQMPVCLEGSELELQTVHVFFSMMKSIKSCNAPQLTWRVSIQKKGGFPGVVVFDLT
jgi:hypothetical protein